MPGGTIKRLVRDRGFGFIRDDGGQEWFFHRSAVEGSFDQLNEGQRVSFDEAIVKKLKVMDATALTLCRDQKLPICVFSIFKAGALKRVVLGEDEGTLVHA